MDLSGSILIAMPGMGDPRFDKSVILICAHSDEGAMGLIINKPSPDLSFSALLDHLDIGRAPAGRDIRVHFGGPVERGRGFVLHSRDYAPGAGSMMVPGVGRGGLAMTATQDILADLAQGGGPSQALLALGYAGWGPGQLEGEIARNDWLTAVAPEGLIFAADDSAKWGLALRSMGIDPLSLSAVSGRA
ncbi:MAG: YqgE/AlgH family protein [Gemmobacter sp.]|uniref:YqgE/AlgH family protein n=1 Tax=Gemmobacter sp. TaxID=1898957 RepID=UPI001A61A24D|nr:YqgE/AlgH family protein [Gemmobacter sp.]MBL8561665.1 YqgE/AlgH family protein [Gemmobacter sp.]